MSEQIIRDVIAERDRLRDRLMDQDRLAKLESQVAVNRTLFDSYVDRAPDEEDMRKLAENLEDEMKEAVKDFKDEIRRERESWLSDMRNAIHDGQEATRQAIKEQHSRWVNRALVVAAIIMSVLVGGIESGMKALTAAGVGFP